LEGDGRGLLECTDQTFAWESDPKLRGTSFRWPEFEPGAVHKDGGDVCSCE